MPSKQSQRVKIINFKDKNTEKNYTLMIGERTGFRDVWINGQHFYYNRYQTQPMSQKIDVSNLINQQQKTPRQTIVIRRRSG